MDVVALGLAKADAAKRYALRFQSGYSGGAPDAQLPTTRTINVAGASGSTTAYSVLGFQNNDPNAPDSATRLYIVPRANQHVTTGVGGALKIFGDDYFATDGTSANYRDFGLYFSADQGGDTGQQANGVFWLNSKTNGTNLGKNADIGFSFQDGAIIAGRWAYISTTQAALIVGPSKPQVATKSTVIGLEMQSDIGFLATHGLRWLDGASNLTNFMQLNATDVTLKLGGVQMLRVTSLGSLVQGSTQLGAASTDGFFYLRTINGTPTGTPTAQTGTLPMAYDSVNHKLWVYDAGWKGVTLA